MRREQIQVHLDVHNQIRQLFLMAWPQLCQRLKILSHIREVIPRPPNLINKRCPLHQTQVFNRYAATIHYQPNSQCQITGANHPSGAHPQVLYGVFRKKTCQFVSRNGHFFHFGGLILCDANKSNNSIN